MPMNVLICSLSTSLRNIPLFRDGLGYVCEMLLSMLKAITYMQNHRNTRTDITYVFFRGGTCCLMGYKLTFEIFFLACIIFTSRTAMRDTIIRAFILLSKYGEHIHSRCNVQDWQFGMLRFLSGCAF